MDAGMTTIVMLVTAFVTSWRDHHKPKHQTTGGLENNIADSAHSSVCTIVDGDRAPGYSLTAFFG